jgi:hypothetical protein
VRVSGLIGGGGVRLVEHFAEVDEMRLRGGALCKRAGLPAGDEFSKRERHRVLLGEVQFLQSGVGLRSARADSPSPPRIRFGPSKAGEPPE